MAGDDSPGRPDIRAGRDSYAAGGDIHVSRAAGPGGNYFEAVYLGVPASEPHREHTLLALPRKARVFTGRESALADLLALLGPDRSADGQPRAAVITGLPGIGKTELAVQAAYAALENGWFPGGALFIDMRGYDQERAMTAGAALDGLLRAAGVPAEDILPEDHRPGQFASVMAGKAAEGRPVLVVIDNVASADIAEALLPAAGGALVTTRHTMTSLRAPQIGLDELSEAAAVEMLAGELRERWATDARVADQQEDAIAIARFCGQLPLALYIVAALLAEDTSRPLSSMASDLREADTRLDEMSYQGPEGVRAVSAAFDLSYRQLDDEQKRVLRLLPLNLGQEIATEAVAAMAELPVRTARWRLAELRRAHLISSGRPHRGNGRWRMHDLISLYVSGLPAEPADLRAAGLRLLAYYRSSTWAATQLLDPAASRPADSPFANRREALEWLDAEYPNLTPFGSMVLAGPGIAPNLTTDLFLWLWRYFELRRRTDDWITLTGQALAVARAFGDRGREGEALTKLGGALRQARRFDEAASACRDAISIQRELGNRPAEGVALNNLAAALLAADRYEEAVVAARDAAGIFQENGDRHREGIAISHLGGALTGTGQYAEGVAAYEKAAAIFREVSDRHGESLVLTSLGNALRLGGRGLEEAIDLHRRSAEGMEQAGDHYSQGQALVNLTAALIEAAHFDEAVAAGRKAVALLQDGKDLHSLGGALVNLGSALMETGQPDGAVGALGDAVTAYRRSGDLDAVAETQISLGTVLEQAGNREAAIEIFRNTAEMCRRTANGRGEGRALGSLGYALFTAKQYSEAVATLRAALAAARTAKDPEGQAKALFFLATALGHDHADEAISAYRDAAEMLRQAGREELALLASDALRLAESVKRMREMLDAWVAAGRFEDLIADYRASAKFASQVADRDIVGVRAADVAGSLYRAKRFGQAIPLLEEAVTEFRAAGSLERERAARAELEAVKKAQLDARASADTLARALRSARSDSQGNVQAVQAAFDDARRHLGPQDARFFRLLSASPGPDISLEAAAILAAGQALTLPGLKKLSDLAIARRHQVLFRLMSDLLGKNAEIARGALAVLAQMRLVERDPANPERWRRPAAIRPFAAEEGREHAEQDRREPTRTLMHLYYLAGALASSVPLSAGVITPALHRIRGRAQGLRWLAAEYQNLLAAVRDASDDDLGAVIALDLTRSLTSSTLLERHLDDALVLGPIARRAARRLRDRHAEAAVLSNLGNHLTLAGQPDKAITALREALAIYQDLDDRDGEGVTLTYLGRALTRAGQFAEAADGLHAAIAIHRQSGQRFSEAGALSGLGVLLDTTGQLDQAVTAFQDADRIYREREISDHYHRAGTLVQLAGTLRKAGRHDEAVKAYLKAVTLAQLAWNQPLAAVALARLAEAYRATGRQSEADAALQEAAQAADEAEKAADGAAGSGYPDPVRSTAEPAVRPAFPWALPSPGLSFPVGSAP